MAARKCMAELTFSSYNPQNSDLSRLHTNLYQPSEPYGSHADNLSPLLPPLFGDTLHHFVPSDPNYLIPQSDPLRWKLVILSEVNKYQVTRSNPYLKTSIANQPFRVKLFTCRPSAPEVAWQAYLYECVSSSDGTERNELIPGAISSMLVFFLFLAVGFFFLRKIKKDNKCSIIYLSFSSQTSV